MSDDYNFRQTWIIYSLFKKWTDTRRGLNIIIEKPKDVSFITAPVLEIYIKWNTLGFFPWKYECKTGSFILLKRKCYITIILRINNIINYIVFLAGTTWQSLQLDKVPAFQPCRSDFSSTLLLPFLMILTTNAFPFGKFCVGFSKE